METTIMGLCKPLLRWYDLRLWGEATMKVPSPRWMLTVPDPSVGWRDPLLPSLSRGFVENSKSMAVRKMVAI